MDLKSTLAKNYINFLGWSTKRKLVLIESDDWGSVRVANVGVWERLSKKYPQVEAHKFLRYDGLERTADLEHLFELLSKFKDSNNKSPVITALALTSNPDFSKIAKTGDYYSESIVETYANYDEEAILPLWRDEGINKNLLYPQFHGKEHLYPERYMNRIANLNDSEYDAFINKSVFGIDNTSRQKNFLAAFEYHSKADKIIIEKRTEEGLKEFKNLFGIESKSFCPSQSVYGDHIFPVLKDNGVLSIQAGQQLLPKDMMLEKINHKWGDKTSNGLIFWRRNCTFEPYKSKSFDHVDECLKHVEIAFRWGKPAVINSHRINYTSRLRSELRDRTYTDLNEMFRIMLKRWPDIEFVNSAQLAEIMHAEIK